MSRRQYPLRPGYASTFNCAQGRTFQKVVLDARHCPFTHGHLNVALSRVRMMGDLKILASVDNVDVDGHALIRNIVWPELLVHSSNNFNHSKTSGLRKRPASAMS